MLHHAIVCTMYCYIRVNVAVSMRAVVRSLLCVCYCVHKHLFTRVCVCDVC